MNFVFSLILTFSAVASPLTDNYTDIQAFMRHLVQLHPDTTRLVTIGRANSGEIIEGLKIGTGRLQNLVVATHHGNEYGSTEVARAFAQSLSERPLADQTIFVIPVLNTAGYNVRGRNEQADGRSFDPNRDYPGPCGTEGPFKLNSTTALAAFVDQHQIVASATLHTNFPAVVYPWGFNTPDLDTAYMDIFKFLVRAATVESRYKTGNSSEVIYPAAGTFEDYAFWRHGIWSLLFELGHTHNPKKADVVKMIQENIPGLRRMFENAPRKRAEDHEFKGRCGTLSIRDRHDE